MRIKPRRMAVVGIVSPMCNFGLRLINMRFVLIYFQLLTFGSIASHNV